MPSVSDNVELMQKHLPKCPICESERGYKLSAFYPNIQCKSCKAEWLVFNDGLELKGTSTEGWDKKRLDMVQSARRVIGCGGAFPPYEGLIKKFEKAHNFDEALALRPAQRNKMRLQPTINSNQTKL